MRGRTASASAAGQSSWAVSTSDATMALCFVGRHAPVVVQSALIESGSTVTTSCAAAWALAVWSDLRSWLLLIN